MIIIVLFEKEETRYISTRFGVEHTCRKIAKYRLEAGWYSEVDSEHLSLLLKQPSNDLYSVVYRWLEARKDRPGEGIELHALEEI